LQPNLNKLTMKKLFFAAVAVLSFAGANAQEIKYGVRGGLNLASVSAENTEGIKSAITSYVGAFAEFKLADKFAVQPELQWNQTGYNIEGIDFGLISADFPVRLNYLNIPVVAKYMATENFSLLAGPNVGILLSATVNGIDVKDETSSVDFGMNLGAEYMFGENWGMDLRYNLGLSKIGKDSDDKTKNRVLSLGAIYKF
jgi:opacity protein-like surface antigen